MFIGVVGTRNFGPNNRLPARAFLTQLQFPPNSRVLRAVTFDITVCMYYPTNLTLNLVRFGVDRTFEIMMHRCASTSPAARPTIPSTRRAPFFSLQ